MKKPAVKITVTVLAAIAAILLAFHITAVAVISSEYDGEGGFSAFLWAESELGKYKVKEIFTKIKYKFTGKLDFNGVVKSGEYLFPTDKEPFDYVSDAEGTLAFSEEESRAILDQMLIRREAHALDGAEFYVFVIPNSQTVLKNGFPFGSAGSASRAEKLSEYLKQNGFEDFYILDGAFESAGYEPFHNTENAVNGYGAYLSFEYIVSRLPEQLTRRMNEITAGEDDVKVYYTDGRSLAEKVKLQKVIKNKTVYFDTEKQMEYTIEPELDLPEGVSSVPDGYLLDTPILSVSTVTVTGPDAPSRRTSAVPSGETAVSVTGRPGLSSTLSAKSTAERTQSAVPRRASPTGRERRKSKSAPVVRSKST